MLSAPSGAGKTTLARRLVASLPDLVISRSFTSRSPRSGEVDGVDYTFVERARFDEMVEAGAFLEWAEVHGHRYGTGAETTAALRARGQDVVLVIDVQGAAQIRTHVPDAIGVFLLPPSFEVLEARLRARSEADGAHVSEADLTRRLATAAREVDARHAYDYVVINDELEGSLAQLEHIVLAERQRTSVMASRADAIAKTFGEKG